jgi:hypothetical protein
VSDMAESSNAVPDAVVDEEGLEVAGTERSASPRPSPGTGPGSSGCWMGCEVGLVGEPPGPECELGRSMSRARMLGVLPLLDSRRERRGRGASGEEGGPVALETRGAMGAAGAFALSALGGGVVLAGGLDTGG